MWNKAQRHKSTKCALPTSPLQSSAIQFTKQWWSHTSCSCAQLPFSTFYMLHLFFCQVLWFLLTVTQLLRKGKRHKVMCNRVWFQEDKIMVNVRSSLHMKEKNTEKRIESSISFALPFLSFPHFHLSFSVTERESERRLYFTLKNHIAILTTCHHLFCCINPSAAWHSCISWWDEVFCVQMFTFHCWLQKVQWTEQTRYFPFSCCQRGERQSIT